MTARASLLPRPAEAGPQGRSRGAGGAAGGVAAPAEAGEGERSSVHPGLRELGPAAKDSPLMGVVESTNLSKVYRLLALGLQVGSY